MLLFKACPKCHGDLQVAQDVYGKYVNCLQCGYLKDLALPKVAVPVFKQDDPELVEAAPARRKAA